MSFFSRVITGCLVTLGWMLLVVPVWAMKVQPATVNMSALPGATTSTVFLLTNTESVEQTYQFSIQGFVAKGEDGQQDFLPSSEVSGLPSWLYVSTSTIRLLPGETAPINVAFRPTKEATPGAYQAVVFAAHLDSRRQNGMVLGSRVGTLIFATVEGDVRHDLQVESFSLADQHVSYGLPKVFSIVFRNKGNAHEVPEGNVAIYNTFGALVGAVDLQQANDKRVLPGSARRFVVQWGVDQDESAGFWRSLKKEVSPFVLGWYEARLVLVQGSNSGTAQVSFFVLPWRLLSVLGVGVVLLAVVILRKRR